MFAPINPNNEPCPICLICAKAAGENCNEMFMFQPDPCAPGLRCKGSGRGKPYLCMEDAQTAPTCDKPSGSSYWPMAKEQIRMNLEKSIADTYRSQKKLLDELDDEFLPSLGSDEIDEDKEQMCYEVCDDTIDDGSNRHGPQYKKCIKMCMNEKKDKVKKIIMKMCHKMCDEENIIDMVTPQYKKCIKMCMNGLDGMGDMNEMEDKIKEMKIMKDKMNNMEEKPLHHLVS